MALLLHAGLDAGFIHNFWPLMSGGQWIHETVYIEQSPFLKNFIEGKSGVQFVHRMLAYLVCALVFWIYYKAKIKNSLSKYQLIGINSLLIIVILQFALGVFTLILQVPVWLGVAHQIGAFFLISAFTFTLHRFSK